MPPKQTSSGPSAMQTFEDLMVFAWRGLALAAAVELDLFSHIAAGKTSAQPIAAAAGAAGHAARRAAPAARGGPEPIKKTGKNYGPQPGAAELWGGGKPLYMGDSAMIGKMLMGPWSM